MGENFDVLVWRAGQVDKNGYSFTAEALKGMADGLRPGWDITFNFDYLRVVGHVVQAWIDGDDLYVTATFDDPDIIAALRDGKATIRPGFEIMASHHEQGMDFVVIDEVGEAHVAMTPNPMPLPGEPHANS